MAASVIAAVLERLESFTYAGAVPVYFDEAPGGTTPPYVVLKDDGTVPNYTLEYKLANEITTLRLEVYALSLASLDAISEVIRYNGGGVSDGAGLDNCDLTVTGQECESVVRDFEQPFQEQARYDADALVFRNTMRYRVAMQRT